MTAGTFLLQTRTRGLVARNGARGALRIAISAVKANTAIAAAPGSLQPHVPFEQRTEPRPAPSRQLRTSSGREVAPPVADTEPAGPPAENDDVQARLLAMGMNFAF